MSFKRFFLIVEGNTDDDFVEFVLRPFIERMLAVDHVDVVHWSTKSDAQRRDLIHSITSIGASYIFLHDLDEGCKSHRLGVLLREFPYIDGASIALACYEIESWYCAGAPAITLQQLGFREHEVERVRKEQFVQHCISRHLDPLTVKLEILSSFEFDAAKERSPSFRRLIERQLGQIGAGT